MATNETAPGTNAQLFTGRFYIIYILNVENVKLQ